ncbi:MAG: alkaline phosphatase family protein [Caulobacteraceae bacterium]
MRTAVAVALVWLGLAANAGARADSMTAADRAVPRYAHVVVIVEENKDYEQLLDSGLAPNMASWAKRYGTATRFFGEVHPSEANYVALLGGDTFGIHDDDAYYCRPGLTDRFCWGARVPGYVDHTVHATHLGEQLEAAGLTWKGYYENLPQPGSLDVFAGGPPPGGPLSALYASKHSGFINFASVQTDPQRAQHLVGFGQLDADLASNRLPSFALLIPNQCDEMHGLFVADPPAGCDARDRAGLIRRGDRVLGELVGKIQSSPAWRAKANFAIVITFDESGNGAREGCCAVTSAAPSNFGGGHIPTIVITNHGPRGVTDATPYNHYSLLRTIEDAFGLREHLRHAADTAQGVAPMTRLFATAPTTSGPTGALR